jgi:hypothetical protein
MANPNTNTNTQMSAPVDEAEQSFFRLCEFEQIKVDKYTIKHNLNKWQLALGGYALKGDKLQIEISPPYAEMHLTVKETPADPDFYGKNTARVLVSNEVPSADSLMGYFASKTTTLMISPDTEYLLFDSPYFYPHNVYTVTNKEYLYKKISHSINYMKYFIQAYKDIFQSGVPLIYVKETRETRNHYEIDFILKEYLTISYVKTDVDTATLYLHLLMETAKKTISDNKDGVKRVAKFHQITVKIPRLIRSGNVDFKFTANMI